MLMYSPVRKGLITEPSSSLYPPPTFDNIHIQDDQFPPELLQDTTLQCFQQQPQQPRLQSPFQYPQGFQFVSPLSSAPSSPTFSSPTFSVAYPSATAVSTEYPAVFDGNYYEAPSMTPDSSYNPSIHVQSPPAYYQFGSPMLAQQSVASNHGWEGAGGNLQLLSPARIHSNLPRSGFQDTQKRASPSSSSRSAAAGNPVSPLTAASSSAYNAQPRGVGSSTVPKPLPTPVQTPVQNSFLAAPFQNYDPSSHDGNHTEAEIAMRRAVMEQQQQQQHTSQHQHHPTDYSLAPSVSSVSHNSPVTPQTTYDETDDAAKAVAHGESRFPDVDRWMDEYLRLDALPDYSNPNATALSLGVPKLNRTISDIYQDELYNPAMMPTSQVAKQPVGQNLLTPYRNVFADRLQAASQGHMSVRSQSPVMNISRERSPFRQNSPLAAEFNNVALQPTSIPLSQNGMNLAQHDAQGEPKTMSPKDALLEFHEGTDDAGMPPLFPSSNQADFNLGDMLGLRRESSSSFQPTQNYSSMESFPHQYSTQIAAMHLQQQQPYPFVQQQQTLRSQQQQQSQPQQQAHTTPLTQTSHVSSRLTNLDATGNKPHANVDLATSQGQSQMMMHPVNNAITRPEDTASDGGTYTCTYHGCSLRFETPAKLQKHKREAHRQTTPGGHLIGRDTAMRNSQAGPHKCERINPSTGKPCNSIFSRPYDLTRHEDTIHNARKQKVRCHLCTEEKTFSRNDALTRHMRVVHPEVDWPGKQRRRGRD